MNKKDIAFRRVFGVSYEPEEDVPESLVSKEIMITSQEIIVSNVGSDDHGSVTFELDYKWSLADLYKINRTNGFIYLIFKTPADHLHSDAKLKPPIYLTILEKEPVQIAKFLEFLADALTSLAPLRQSKSLPDCTEVEPEADGPEVASANKRKSKNVNSAKNIKSRAKPIPESSEELSPMPNDSGSSSNIIKIDEKSQRRRIHMKQKSLDLCHKGEVTSQPNLILKDSKTQKDSLSNGYRQSSESSLKEAPTQKEPSSHSGHIRQSSTSVKEATTQKEPSSHSGHIRQSSTSVKATVQKRHFGHIRQTSTSVKEPTFQKEPSSTCIKEESTAQKEPLSHSGHMGHVRQPSTSLRDSIVEKEPTAQKPPLNRSTSRSGHIRQSSHSGPTNHIRQTIATFRDSLVEKEPTAQKEPIVQKEPAAQKKPPAQKKPLMGHIRQTSASFRDSLVEKEPTAQKEPIVQKEPPAHKKPLMGHIRQTSASFRDSLVEKEPTAQKESTVQKESLVQKEPAAQKKPLSHSGHIRQFSASIRESLVEKEHKADKKDPVSHTGHIRQSSASIRESLVEKEPAAEKEPLSHIKQFSGCLRESLVEKEPAADKKEPKTQRETKTPHIGHIRQSSAVSIKESLKEPTALNSSSNTRHTIVAFKEEAENIKPGETIKEPIHKVSGHTRQPSNSQPTGQNPATRLYCVSKLNSTQNTETSTSTDPPVLKEAKYNVKPKLSLRNISKHSRSASQDLVNNNRTVKQEKKLVNKKENNQENISIAQSSYSIPENSSSQSPSEPLLLSPSLVKNLSIQQLVFFPPANHRSKAPCDCILCNFQTRQKSKVIGSPASSSLLSDDTPSMTSPIILQKTISENDITFSEVQEALNELYQ